MIVEKRRRILIISCASLIFSFFLAMTLYRLSFIKYRICPKIEQVLHLKTNKCYSKYERGPCSPDMILMPLLNNRSVGVCHCDNLNNERTLVFNNITERCYFVFTQGYCEAGSWVILSPEGASCAPNFCLNHLNTFEELSKGHSVVPLSDGSCRVLGQSCVEEGEVLRFFKGKLYPSCKPSPSLWGQRGKQKGIFAGFGVPQTDCPEGFYRTDMGHCAVEFDDS